MQHHAGARRRSHAANGANKCDIKCRYEVCAVLDLVVSTCSAYDYCRLPARQADRQAGRQRDRQTEKIRDYGCMYVGTTRQRGIDY